MNTPLHFTSVHFRNFKAFKDYWVSLSDFNVLVGPNNAGKSTILGSFRILAEGIRKARSRKPTLVPGPDHVTLGYQISLDEVPIATENIFTDYDDTSPAHVTYRVSNGNELLLYFPDTSRCFFFCTTKKAQIKTPAQFKKEFKLSIGFVPILGPVEHNELLYQKEAARLALLTHRASRNFRNIWHHYPDKFEDFRRFINSTWPGMDIAKPEIDYSGKKTRLHMFCYENRIPRELFWSGFGFQVWCQMLTFIINSSGDTLFIIDEPDIYMHSDLQRQLVSILKNLGPNIMLATHSIEIISECEPDDLLVIDKSHNSAKRIKNPTQLQNIFNTLGSNLNPILTQLAKNKRALFVEGKDFKILSKFAHKLKLYHVANRSGFTVIPVEGYNPEKVKDIAKGMEITLGIKIVIGVVFDRDYRSQYEVEAVLKDLKKTSKLVHIHKRKELENYLIEINPIKKAILTKLTNKNRRTGTAAQFTEDINQLILNLSDQMRHEVEAQFLAKQAPFIKNIQPHLDDSTINTKLLKEFDKKWNDIASRISLIPGKKFIAHLNNYLQKSYKITLTLSQLVDCFDKSQIDDELSQLLKMIDEFRYY